MSLLVSFVMYISDAKFKDHCSNISRDILDWVLYCLSGSDVFGRVALGTILGTRMNNTSYRGSGGDISGLSMSSRQNEAIGSSSL